ncbi:MAG TPA: alpha/beta hydrolase [Phenylobacterium sp.]|jgi:pimeloyl-ACP methyl ester carboxylesterase|uniref:alpha/beta fold hydrolase n=1 Tax=Phenylobacterium sp. TaxID=1871053 RepID=UPI002BD12BA5|nr:alpha/beta hydrolase [Phenylobacterium sp.]HXA38449.1 alpha/beta hydrolase [Phenylobacterium sp.]
MSVALSAPPSRPPRGEMVDVGGRRLRMVRAGPASDRPTVVLEHGAFGCATDWTVVQARLAAKGLSSLAYDRAGLGHSEPGPKPRDGMAIVSDLAALLREAGVEGPFVLAGHSMGGLMVRLFALTHPEQVLGVVLVDAVTPDVVSHPVGGKGVDAFSRILGWTSEGAKYGMMLPVAAVAGDRIGLPPEASAEKRQIYGLASHAHWAAQEVSQWRATSDQARAADFPPAMPIAVITAGARTVTALKEIQSVPALASLNGYIEHVAGAGHANLLGRRFADPIVRGVEHVLATARR